jgi:hypothetical protein
MITENTEHAKVNLAVNGKLLIPLEKWFLCGVRQASKEVGNSTSDANTAQGNIEGPSLAFA